MKTNNIILKTFATMLLAVAAFASESIYIWGDSETTPVYADSGTLTVTQTGTDEYVIDLFLKQGYQNIDLHYSGAIDTHISKD